MSSSLMIQTILLIAMDKLCVNSADTLSDACIASSPPMLGQNELEKIVLTIVVGGGQWMLLGVKAQSNGDVQSVFRWKLWALDLGKQWMSTP